MKSAEIRQSFLDFFAKKQHTIVPSASLMPQSPGLLFTNAGMNQFVPYFLGTDRAPYSPPRAADTQKCIRAGGKHNDLEDVGYDSYHHTFFEMLGNWSFGNYFKKEAIDWGWELIVERWGVPAERLYATVYAPSKSEPSEFDQEAYDYWAALFKGKGLDPTVHIINGNKKDNFWMMGETGPCGPCSELHVDLTPEGDSKGALVNQDSDLCIEIWNLVFIQFNANADGTFSDLPAKHVDTGMGFERACSLIQNTKGFTDFSQKPSNYATDVFQPIFRKIEALCGKTYQDIYPQSVEADKSKFSDEMKEAIAFRVIADHIRTLACSLADGILLGNSGRSYVLRRILRRAVRYGRTLGFSSDKTFLDQLVDTLVSEMSGVFPELASRADAIKENLHREESSFNETLDRGLAIFEQALERQGKVLSGDLAFKLYDTYGFPFDLTQLLCAERGIKVDIATFERRMEEQRELGRQAQTQQHVRANEIASDALTEFVGFENDECSAKVLEVHKQDDSLLVITDQTPMYAEMGGQLGDRGILQVDDQSFEVKTTEQIGAARAHAIQSNASVKVDDQVTLRLDPERRRPIEAHHTATHLLHWALHEIISTDASQQGSLVGPKRLRFDFNSSALRPEQINAIEEKVNDCIESGDTVSSIEIGYEKIKKRQDIQQFFGDKYGDRVRVVKIGGQTEQLDGYSMELCGGTHVSNTADIGIFKIKSEGAIAAGVRRIEAVCGPVAFEWIRGVIEENTVLEEDLRDKLKALNNQLEVLDEEAVIYPDFPHNKETLFGKGCFREKNQVFNDFLAYVQGVKDAVVEADKSLKKARAKGAAKMANLLLAEIDRSGPVVLATEGPAALLQELLNGLKQEQFPHAAFFIVNDGEKLHLGALGGGDSGQNAGKLIQEIAPLANGKGGGKPEMARGAAPDLKKVASVEAKAKEILNLG